MIRELAIAAVLATSAAAAIHSLYTYQEAQRPVPDATFTALGSIDPPHRDALGSAGSAGQRNLFASAPPPTVVIPPPPPLPRESAGAAGLNQLSAGDQVLRVRGIFTTTEKAGALAAVELSGAGQTGTESRRVRPGDSVGEYRVVSIDPSRVHFRGASGEEFTVKIFEEKKKP